LSVSAVLHVKPEEGVPIPEDDPSSMGMLERARLACNTLKALYPLESGEPTEEELDVSRKAFSSLTGVEKGTPPPDVTAYPTHALRHLDKLLSEYDQELVNSAVRLREYVKNKLIEETENPDGKIRIRALELLGKMKDVGLFTDRVEVTYKTKSDEELISEINRKLEKFMGPAQLVTDDEEAPLRLEPEPQETEDMAEFLSSLEPS
jgi:hypothetical protein